MDHHHQQQQKQTNRMGKSTGRQVNRSPQHLSYHRQQLMHQRHLQRIGGLNRLTADIASIVFDPEPDTPHQQPATQATTRVVPTLAKQNHETKQQQQQQQALLLQQQQQPQQQQQQPVVQPQQPQNQSLDRQEHLDLPKSDTGSQEAERLEAAARDAQETAEDAAILKRYRICNLIGTGNYARVYRGLLVSNNKELAIKSINLTKTSENYRQKFLPRELSILKRVSHINICKIYEILQVADRIFIVMQYCSRGTIADLLQKNQGPLNETTVRYLFAPVVDAIVYLHSLDIAHRDIKVENILLDFEFMPKLTDFSYSCSIGDSIAASPSPFDKAYKTVTTLKSLQHLKNYRGKNQLSLRLNDTFCGTLPYLSPEMIRQFPYDSKKTDVWSLGVCLYVMLNDRLPFPFNDIKLMVKRQLTRDFKFRTNIEVSDACRDLIKQLFDPEFTRRPSGVEVSRHVWLSGPRERPKPIM